MSSSTITNPDGPEAMIPIESIIRAYRHGFFPMADPADGIVRWCQPYKRAVIPLDTCSPSKDVRRLKRKGVFSIRFDTDFEGVIRGCAMPRTYEKETWISEEIVAAYVKLHGLGLAHSVEAWCEGELAGGLYGLAMGGAFFGESMFYRMPYASQVAFDRLVVHLRERGYLMLDAQIMNPYLKKLGAVEIDHEEYMVQLEQALAKKILFI
jgi:leucyl/phenylalanyl-tRNA--protein transferase